MNWNQAVPALAWLAFGLVVSAGAHALGLGRLNEPGPGLFPFVIGIGISALALSILVSGTRTPAAHVKQQTASRQFGGVLGVIAGLAFYALALERIGFLLCTALFLFALFVLLGRRSWPIALAASIGVTLGSYVLFVWALKINLPIGPLGI